MGYGCTICDDCLEVPAPDYTEGQAGRPAEASGSADVDPTDAIIESVVRQTPNRRPPARRGNARRKTTKDIRDGAPGDVVVTPCGHLFHQICIAQWFKDKNSMNCPACRKLCQQSKLIRVYPTVVPYHPGIDDGFILDQPIPNVRVEPVPAPGPSRIKVEAAASASSCEAGPSTSTQGLNLRAPTQDAGPAMTNAGTFQDPLNVPDDDDNNQPANSRTGSRRSSELCTRPDCEDIRFLRLTLMQDFEDLSNKYSEALEEVSMRQATEQSYLTHIATLEKDRDTLRTKISEENKQVFQLGVKHSDVIAGLERDVAELRSRVSLRSDGPAQESSNMAHCSQKRSSTASASASCSAAVAVVGEDPTPAKRHRNPERLSSRQAGEGCV